MKIAIFAKLDKSVVPLCLDIYNHLEKCGVDIIIDGKSAELMQKAVSEGSPDAVVVVGGDGAVLNAEFVYPGVPLICIGAGRVSFFANISAENALTAIDRFLDHNYIIDKRMKLRIKNKDLPDALNEYAITTKKPVTIIEYTLYANHHEIRDFRADGVVLSTSTGSTAYALSSGGPFVDKDAQVFNIVPISPFRLTSRPLIMSCDKTIGVKMGSKPAVLVVDGQKVVDIESDEMLIFEKSDVYTQFVRLDDMNYFERIRRLIE